LKLPGEQVTIREGKGVLVDRETHIELWWLLPPQSALEQPGQFEIVLSASKNFSKDELLKVTESVTTNAGSPHPL